MAEGTPEPKAGTPETALGAVVPSRSLDRLREVHPAMILEVAFHCSAPIVRIDPAGVVEVCRFLKEDPGCGMTHLASLCGLDLVRLGRPDPRFDVVYHLFSLVLGERLTLKAAVPDGGEIATVSGVWRTAIWHERETFDMFGIRFAGHPDPRRILMPEDFDAFPLRKDFPLEGREQDHGYWRRPEDEQRGVVTRS